MGGIPWLTVIWGFTNFAIWLALWPLTITGVLPLWVAFPIATICVALCYLPSHEAQHRIIARPGEKLFWLNELLGNISIVPLVVPFSVARLTHNQHHIHTNHTELDPDIASRSRNAWHCLTKSIANRQPGAKAAGSYGNTLRRLNTPESHQALRTGLIFQLVHLAILSTLAWNGYALVAAAVWWLPRLIGHTYIHFYLSWAPHHPTLGSGRYENTRAFRSRLGNIGSMGMQYHIIHHLYPTIPITRNPAAYRALRPVLQAWKCRLDGI